MEIKLRKKYCRNIHTVYRTSKSLDQMHIKVSLKYIQESRVKFYTHRRVQFEIFIPFSYIFSVQLYFFLTVIFLLCSYILPFCNISFFLLYFFLSAFFSLSYIVFFSSYVSYFQLYFFLSGLFLYVQLYLLLSAIFLSSTIVLTFNFLHIC